ncbi:Ff.00g114260.m01.CDS01 [Fusarium sp. VM40]|nr:Ff.00g114260.m01.CDS01 [Fusarium sp. VM40]
MANLLRFLDLPPWSIFVIGALYAILATVNLTRRQKMSDSVTKNPNVPVSVNYFPSRKCNYTCGFCFHTDTSSSVLPVEEAKRGLKLLKEAEELAIESISILDILAISCDSFHSETNKKIGRGDDGGNVTRLFRIADWCREYGIKFKLNTVVNVHNWDEDMAADIERLAPFRWKVFQCLLVAGENEDATRLRDARIFLVTEEQWKTFCDRHKHLPCYVPEDNNSMASSYLLLDEDMCFLDKGEGMMTKSESILKVGVQKAMEQVVWDKTSFVDRGGIYDWGRSDMAKDSGCSGEKSEDLQW